MKMILIVPYMLLLYLLMAIVTGIMSASKWLYKVTHIAGEHLSRHIRSLIDE
jgi:hypothetical protein